MNRPFKFFFLLVFVLLLLVTPGSRAAEDLASRISGVSLYAEQALVTRRAETQVSKGTHTLQVGIEAFRVDPDSAAARVKGDGSILGVQMKTIPLEHAPQPRIKDLEKQIEDRQQALRKLEDDKLGLAKQEKFLEGFLTFSKAQISEEMATRMPSAEELQATLGFLAANYGEIYTARQALDHSITEGQRELARLKKELAALQNRTARSRQIIEVIFEADQDQTIIVEADYLVGHTRWEPLYKAAVPSTLEHAQLTMFARIEQKSGEDWNNVPIEISNAVPARGVALPDLSTWWLDVPRPVASAPAKQSKVVLRSPKIEADLALAPAEVLGKSVAPAPLAQARRERSALDFTYTPPRPVTIPSRKQETLIPLYTKQLTGQFYHYAVPKRDSRTFLVCEVKADSELLPGRLNVYFDGRYLGRTQLAEQTAGKALRLNLGIDREVKVQRRKLVDKLKETYFGKIERNSVVRQLTYQTVIENRKAQPVTLYLWDHLPVSRTDRIKIEDITLSPPPAAKDARERKGVARWELSLAPKASQTLKMEFVVIHPKEMQLPHF